MDQLGLFMRALYETEREVARHAPVRRREDTPVWRRLVRLLRSRD
jgi:hypothetical protein